MVEKCRAITNQSFTGQYIDILLEINKGRADINNFDEL
jgi:hypothetical protein